MAVQERNSELVDILLPDIVAQCNSHSFRAYLSADQSIPSGSTSVVELDTVQLGDTSGWFNTSTYRLEPEIAGYWHINAAIFFYNAGAGQYVQTYLIRNGSSISAARNISVASGSDLSAVISDIVYLDGSTHYLQIGGRQNSGTDQDIFGNTDYTFMSGHYLGN